MTTKMQSCVDHIKTSLDVDQWAAEMVEKIFTEYDRRFDRVLEIIEGRDLWERREGCMWTVGEEIKQEILRLKEGEQE